MVVFRLAPGILFILSIAICSGSTWTEFGPVIQMGDDPTRPYMVWNDPSVLRDKGNYRMWLSGGDARDLNNIRVDVYDAVSNDGKSWQIGTQRVLSPSANPNDWDGLRIETPTVVKVGSVYHLYYTGFNAATAQTGISAIGHATSPDGSRWTKDPKNPILTGQSTNPGRWGYGGVGEPGILYHQASKQFYLYFAAMRYAPSNPSIGHMGILLATSPDGSVFRTLADSSGEPRLILFRDVPGAIDGAWFGYSSPAAYPLTSGEIQLLATFVVAEGGPTTARSVLLTRATSADGVNFEVKDPMIFTAGNGDWKDHQVRAATVLESGGKLLMWFAGERSNPFGAGVGFASASLP